MSQESSNQDINQRQIVVQEIVLLRPNQEYMTNTIIPSHQMASSSNMIEENEQEAQDHLNVLKNEDGVIGNGKVTDYAWDAISTMKLLAYRRELSPLIAARSISRKNVFLKIAKYLSTLDHRRLHPTAEQCDNKWKWLKRKYCTIRAKLLENPGGTAKNLKFQYYQEMDEIMNIESQNIQIQVGKLPKSTKITQSPHDTDAMQIDYDYEDEEGFQWDKKSTMLFLDIKKEIDELIADSNIPKEKLFDKISDLMAISMPKNKGCPSPERCETRWRWLLKNYNLYQQSEIDDIQFPYAEKMNQVTLDSEVEGTVLDEDDSIYLDYAMFSSQYNTKSRGRKRKHQGDDLTQVYACVNEANRDQKDRQFGHMVELMQARTAAIDRQTDVLKQILDHMQESAPKTNESVK